jgi:putative flavoprotein involved in K+ transport
MYYDFIVIGAAQAGLSIAYELQKRNYRFLILDKEEEIGASWLNRWDSLRLFTPTEFNHLEGLPFPAPVGHYPSKFEVANYFKAYVMTFQFPIQLNTLVTKIEKTTPKSFLVHTQKEILQTRNVVVATGPFHVPYTPRFSKYICKDIFQLHSNYYQHPSQLQDGPVMVVGAGDSGFQILDEVSKNQNRKVYYSGDTKVGTLPQEFLGKTLWWWFTKTGFLSIHKNSWLGKLISEGRQPVIGTHVKEILARTNVTSVGRCLDAEDHFIETEEKELTDVKNIVWATGYRPNFKWIKGLELDKDNYPKHKRGISSMKGLYFIGLPWLHTRGSATLGGIKKDANFLGNCIQENYIKQASPNPKEDLHS